MAQILGPVEYLIVDFPGNEFSGEIIPALNDLVDSETIRIIDLSIISKDAEGNVTIFEASELASEVADALVKLEGEHDELLSEADLLMAAEEMPNNSTAAALLFENLWAARFAQAVRNANGEVLMNVRIPNETVLAVRQSIIDAAKSS
ncbi:DUF6325 family protein [Caldilinea sp.]|uniref:DUF6325 family protein n=1 Tax=Caldilinea sp. TaxID=2293560 RepID=UPI002C6380AD|nr:hypothetical protein [Anaerolineales bacterium]HQY90654.1 DUF6325 family protein [Caldilinea sp.]HRA64444.1 DUF6325 family protein [Caldilinea sp.]